MTSRISKHTTLAQRVQILARPGRRTSAWQRQVRRLSMLVQHAAHVHHLSDTYATVPGDPGSLTPEEAAWQFWRSLPPASRAGVSSLRDGSYAVRVYTDTDWYTVRFAYPASAFTVLTP